MKEGGAVGRHQDGGSGDLGERRDLRIGQRHDRHALARRITRAVDGGAGIGLDAGGQKHICGAGIADGVQAGAAGIVQHHRLVAQERQHVVEVPGRGVAGAQPQAIDTPRLMQAAGRIDQAFERRRFGKGCDLARQAERHLRCQRPLAAQLLRLDLDARLAGEAQGAGPHGTGIELAHLVVAFETQPLGKPCHGGGRHAGAPRLFAHGQERHVVGTVEHVARGRLQLRRQDVERLDDRGVERASVQRTPAQRSGSGYISPPLVHSPLRPRASLSGLPMPTLRS